MANILLGVTGSVAAVRVPLIYSLFRAANHSVKVVATDSSLYFFDPCELDPELPSRNREVVILDEDEWPGRDQGKRYQRGEPVIHIELRRWADVFVLAPLDANTLAKLACGLADNCLTCVWRAWDPDRPVVLAPAMNTLMWENPLTAQHLRQIAFIRKQETVPADIDLSKLPSWINDHCSRLRVVPPVTKELACGDIGMGALADASQITQITESVLSEIRRKYSPAEKSS